MLNNDLNKRATKKYKILIPMKVHNASLFSNLNTPWGATCLWEEMAANRATRDPELRGHDDAPFSPLALWPPSKLVHQVLVLVLTMLVNCLFIYAVST
tara:strand:+ start:81 stop:374 length:294 start_codon:yes stop_codon:yes gene_type:complete